jgi:hypothetical protein
MIAVDADLSVSTINHLADHARDYGKPLFISVGSSAAGERSWIESHAENMATCLSARLVVLRPLLEKLAIPQPQIDAFQHLVETGEASSLLDINELCRKLKTKYLLCCNVQKSQGFALLAAGLAPRHHYFKTPADVRTRVQGGNSAGVMDGAMVGFIQSYARVAKGKAGDGAVVDDRTQKVFDTNILDLVRYVSESEGATPGSVISFDEQEQEGSRVPSSGA